VVTSVATLTEFISAVIIETADKVAFNPADLADLGVRNIESYRLEIANNIDRRVDDVDIRVAIFQICKTQGKRERILRGLRSKPALIRADPGRGAVAWFDRYTCDKTADHTANSVCTLKVAPSFPEICAAIHVAEMQDAAPAEIVSSLLRQLWFGSVWLSPTLQARNKEESKAQWDSWGEDGKKNSLDEVIGFDEKIYKNIANDKITLKTPSGRDIQPAVNTGPNAGYTGTELTNYVNSWKSEKPTVPNPVTETVPAVGTETAREGLANLFRRG
jgi:hypothetical protein